MAKKTIRRKKTGAKRAGASPRGGMAHWYVLGAVVVGGILYMDNRGPGPEAAATGVRTASIERKAGARDGAERKRIERTERGIEQEAVRVRPKQRPAEAVVQTPELMETLPAFSGKWFICTTQTDYCVLDGSTLLYAGRKVRLADVDAPAIAEARCDAERARGGDAKLRLREILNEGDVTLVAAKGASGTAGAAPHLVLRNGQSIGHRLVQEGLARPSTGRHQSWCG